MVRRLRGPLAAAAIGAAGIGVPGCIVSTDIVPTAFNSGALDSAGDPFRDPKDLRASIVERLITDELIDGYFGQGARAAGEHSVAAWLKHAAEHPERFLELAACSAREGDPRCRVDASDRRAAQRQLDARIRTLIEECSGDAPAPICEGRDRPSWPALERTLDEIRLHQGIARAARAVGEVMAENLVDAPAVVTGARRAFNEASRYVADRRWRRERDQLTTGLVVKGGAATGVFSAGVVWTTLHLLSGCMSDDACRRGRDLRVTLLSGTSTGAMIATAADRWSSAATPEARARSVADIARWFTCFSISDLYCVRSAPITSLFVDGEDAEKGVLEFDGIERVLASCVHEGMRRNRSELILNTVDFRTGRLYALSDQSELRTSGCVVQAGLASALLPLIGSPVLHLPVGRRFDPSRPDETEPAYLDGGIRSELPLLPLARRGAERVLVVSSAASVLGETRRLENAIQIATRYIDVSTGGIAESELAHARRHAESVRSSEIEACYDWLKESSAALCPGKECDFPRICELRDFAGACSRRSKSPPDEARRPQAALASYVEPHWRILGVFRDEAEIEPLKGYDFDPVELRRLFRAGAEEARLRCHEIARLLGVAPERGPLDPALEAKIVRWCSTELPRHAEVCAGIVREDHGLRTCGDPPPAYLEACGPVKEVPVCGVMR